MKNSIKHGLLIFATSISSSVVAQLQVQSGATLYLIGNAQVTLQDVSLVNDGSITVASNSRFTFNGSANSQLSGSQQPTFGELEIAKTGNSKLLLQRTINVNGKIVFTTGFIDLLNNNIIMGGIAVLESEDEHSRVMTTGTGYIQVERVLNAPSNNNPANIGVLITSSQNLGVTTIRRGHQSQVNAFGNGSSVLRYFDITPTNNTSLNAALRFTYFDAELNSLPESSITLWRSTNNTTWTNLGFDTRSTTLNYVGKTGIQQFSRFTLTTPGNPLPVHFIMFNARCVNGEARLSWKTAQEINTSRFDVESSADGINWQQSATIPAAGNSTTEQSYSILVPAADQFFRVVAIDLDGRKTYTSIIKLDCERKDDITAWPIPAKDVLTVKINSSNNCNLTLMLHDAKGALLTRKEINLGAGQNQLQLDISKFSNGPYMLTAEWNNYKRTIHIVKQ